MVAAGASVRQYGCNVCGEGGEYETLVLDCPLFARARIVLDAWEARAQSAGGPGAVAILHPTAFHLEPKQARCAPHSADCAPNSHSAAPGQAAGHAGRPGPPPPAASCSGGGWEADPPALVAMMPDDCLMPAAPLAAQEAGRRPASQSEGCTAHVSLQVSSSGALACCSPRLAAGSRAVPADQRVARALHAALSAIQQGAAHSSPAMSRSALFSPQGVAWFHPRSNVVQHATCRGKSKPAA